MKISTRGRYGLRVMMELARCRGEAPLSLRVLAEREDLSKKYLHAVMSGLNTAGLVRSIRGASGGFVLRRDPAKITVADVVRALEGPLSLVDCVVDKGLCAKAKSCRARRVWERMSAGFEDLMDGVTLEEIAGPANVTRAMKSSKRPKKATQLRQTRLTC